MSLFRLVLLSMLNRRGALLLTLISMVVSVTMVLGVERIRDGVRGGFSTTVSGTDLIVGPRGAPLQLVLAALFRIGTADHAIDWSAYEQLRTDPQVAWAIPLAFGDSFQGFPVVATHGDYFRYLKYGRSRSLSFDDGCPFQQSNEVVLGAEVVRRLKLGIGAELELTHGIGEAARHHHDELHFVVVGTLAPTGTPVDRSVHIPLSGMTQLHAGWVGGMPMPGVRVVSAHDHPEQLNAVLLGLHQRTAVFEFKRRIETRPGTALSAVLPALALDQLWQVVVPVERVLQGLALLIFVAASLGMAASLLTALQSRRRELAVLRAVGAKPYHLVLLLLGESALITLTGIATGILLVLLLLSFGEGWLLNRLGVTLANIDASRLIIETGIWLGVLFTGGLFAGAIPALQAYRISLTDGLMVRE
ncbi:MAG: ABC transporter permease [Gammaproteobacteria bacterium]|nr:ABC transporter permease [Gammaproteobacteria bacterium]